MESDALLVQLITKDGGDLIVKAWTGRKPDDILPFLPSWLEKAHKAFDDLEYLHDASSCRLFSSDRS
jgi:hypothetical protein